MSGYFWSQGYKHLANSWNQLDRYIICKHLTTAQQQKEFGRTIKFLLASGAASASCDSISANLANYQTINCYGLKIEGKKIEINETKDSNQQILQSCRCFFS